MREKVVGKVDVLSRLLKEIPEITYLGDPILRTPTKETSVEEGKKIGERLGKVLVKLRKLAGYGRGLAAPQIGIGKSVFVTYLDDNVQIYINPKITERSKKTNFYKELCLSSGIMAADIERSESITMTWTDENGKKQEKEFDGFMARLLQHEEAHLRGIPNLDEACSRTVEIYTGDPLKEKIRETRS